MRSLASSAVLATLIAPGTGLAADLTIVLRDLRVQSGMLQISVVDASGYKGKAAPIAAKAIAPAAGQPRVTFEKLPAGRYAVLVTHDENGNGKLDVNLIGMPLEGYGFSNNPLVMRKPTFDEASFRLGAKDRALEISIR